MILKAIKLERGRRQTKHGSYSLLLTAVVIAAAVMANFIAAELPSKYTQIDMTGQQLSVLGSQSEAVIQELTQDITIYYVVQESNKDSNVARLLQRYEDASGHIKVVEKDSVRYPRFAAAYTEETLTENSLILECGEKSRVIAYEDMYESEFNYEYYSYETTGFDAEGQITSAIAAFQSDSQPRVYTLTGHGETALGETLKNSIEKENIETEELNLISAQSVPEDADALLIVSPQQDLTDAETEKILDYLKGGGHGVIISDYTGSDMPNLDSILEYYGMTRVQGVVIENDSNHYVQMPYYLLPTVNSTEVTENMSGGSAYVLLAAAQGLSLAEDTREGLTVSSVLSTSDSSYSKTDAEHMTTWTKEEGDVDGPFAVGAVASETVELTEEDAAQTRLAVFTSSSLLDSSADQMVSGGNYRLFTNTLSWLCGNEATVSIPAKSISVNYLTVLSASRSFWSIIVIGMIPGACLLFGFGTWFRRRKQ